MKRQLTRTFMFSAAVTVVTALALGVGSVATAADQAVGSVSAPLCASPPPLLYHHPQHASPVRGDPGDVLLIPGVHFTSQTLVVYQAITDTTQPLTQPPMPPSPQTAMRGAIVPVAVDPNAVTVVLPRVMTAGQSYAMWVANPDPSCRYAFSNGILINDARPMWLSPGAVFSAHMRPGLHREIKIVGRNLQPAPGKQTQVRLSGPSDVFTLSAANDGDPATQVERYVAQVTLPQVLPVGNYTVAVSRDGVSWVPLDGGLTVMSDPGVASLFDVSKFGTFGDAAYPCRGDDRLDDTFCITRAIEYARTHGGGDVFLPPGTWIVNANCWPLAADGSVDPNVYGVDSYVFTTPPGSPPPADVPPTKYNACERLWSGLGILVPSGVNLVGSPGLTTIQTDGNFDKPFIDFAHAYHKPDPLPATKDPYVRQNLFVLQGNNIVQGLRFRDAYRPNFQDTGPSSPGAHALMLTGDDITITDNVFEDTYSAIAGLGHTLIGSPLGKGLSGNDLVGNRNVVITGNTFAAYGNSGPVGFAVLEDSVIARNTFVAGAWPNTIAFGTTGGRHVDVSANTINGVDPTYSGGLVGWRAGFFFNHTASQEHVLVAGNRFSCIGSRPGPSPDYKFDGEAISTDAPGNLLGFRSGKWVTGGTATTVTVTSDAMLLSAQKDEYTGRWLQVDCGQGLGQSRKITGAQETPGYVTFTVSPPFDVAPSEGSRIVVFQQTWQMYIVDNAIDNACSHRLPADTYGLIQFNGGLIGVYNSISDSVIEANAQVDTGGIRLSADYNVDEVGNSSTQRAMYFVDVRGNTIERTFGSTLATGQPHQKNAYGGGINLASQIAVSLNGIPSATQDVMGFGVAVARNTIHHAALMQWGASNVWAVGLGTEGALAGESPTPGYVDTLVFGNAIADIPAPWWWPPWWPTGPTGPVGTSLAIANGEAIPNTPFFAPNYPRDTVICDNQTSDGIGDFPPAGSTSTLIGCANGLVTSTTSVSIDNSQSKTRTASFTVRLDAQPAGDVVVTVTSADGHVATVSPASLVFTPSNHATPQAVTVTQVTPQAVSGQTSVTLRRRGYANKAVDVHIADGAPN